MQEDDYYENKKFELTARALFNFGWEEDEESIEFLKTIGEFIFSQLENKNYQFPRFFFGDINEHLENNDKITEDYLINLYKEKTKDLSSIKKFFLEILQEYSEENQISEEIFNNFNANINQWNSTEEAIKSISSIINDFIKKVKKIDVINDSAINLYQNTEIFFEIAKKYFSTHEMTKLEQLFKTEIGFENYSDSVVHSINTISSLYDDFFKSLLKNLANIKNYLKICNNSREISECFFSGNIEFIIEKDNLTISKLKEDIDIYQKEHYLLNNWKNFLESNVSLINSITTDTSCLNIKNEDLANCNSKIKDITEKTKNQLQKTEKCIDSIKNSDNDNINKSVNNFNQINSVIGLIKRNGIFYQQIVDDYQSYYRQINNIKNNCIRFNEEIINSHKNNISIVENNFRKINNTFSNLHFDKENNNTKIIDLIKNYKNSVDEMSYTIKKYLEELSGFLTDIQQMIKIIKNFKNKYIEVSSSEEIKKIFDVFSDQIEPNLVLLEKTEENIKVILNSYHLIIKELENTNTESNNILSKYYSNCQNISGNMNTFYYNAVNGVSKSHNNSKKRNYEEMTKTDSLEARPS